MSLGARLRHGAIHRSYDCRCRGLAEPHPLRSGCRCPQSGAEFSRQTRGGDRPDGGEMRIAARFHVSLFLALAVPLSAHAITVKAVQGPTGVETWFSEEHALPMIAVNISLPAGSAYDPPDKPGLADLTASLLDEGAGDLASDAFKEAMESRAIKLEAT